MKPLEVVRKHVFPNELVYRVAKDSNGIFYRYEYWLNAYIRLNDACQDYLTRQAKNIVIEINEPEYRYCYFLPD